MASLDERRARRKAKKEAKKGGISVFDAQDDGERPPPPLQSEIPEEKDDFVPEIATSLEQFSVSQAGGTEASAGQVELSVVLLLRAFTP